MISFNKKIFFSFLFLFLLNISFVNAQGIYLNNNKVDGANPILAKENRAYIAVSDISLIMGGVTSWDNKEKSVTIYTDDNTIKFTNNSNVMELNGNKISLSFKAFLNNNKLMAPAVVLREYFNYDISWDIKSKNFLINNLTTKKSELKEEIKYSYATDLPKLKNIVRNDSFSFDYALTDNIKNEKYLPDGKYFIFKAHEKGNLTKGLNGYFYMNAYTDDVFYYPIDGADNGNGIKKYHNASEVKDFKKNSMSTIHSLIATTHMINDIKQSDNSLSEFTYTRKNNITAEYLKHIPKATYYYYQANKKENNTLKPQFEIAQNASNLDVYIFLKKENGVNIIKLPNELVKTIELVSKKNTKIKI